LDNTKQSPNQTPEAGWQALGEIKLPAGPAAQQVIAAWLRECTRPLNLGSEMTDKVMECALEASARAVEAGQGPAEAVYVVLCIYAPQEIPAKPDRKHTWGFFKIEKNESGPRDKPLPNDSIELYLYPEGY